MSRAEREKRFKQTTLYPVLTPGLTGGRSLLEVLEAVLAGGARIVQLRDKEDAARYAAEFRRRTEYYKALLIVNDSLEAALKYGADGVHLGQDDPALVSVRATAPDLLLGISAGTLAEAKAAEELGASYVALAPLFPTSTKPDAGEALGVETLREILSKLKVPLVAIGGINKNNLKEVLATGARHIAMITALTEAPDIERATREFLSLIQ